MSINVIDIFFFQNGEAERKHQQQLDQKKVANQMAELKMAKHELEQEVDTHKTRLRLHMEAQVRLTGHESASLELQLPFVSRVIASRPPSACVFEILTGCALVIFRIRGSIHLRLSD